MDKLKQVLEGFMAGILEDLMADAENNLEDDPDSAYDKGYHDALLDVMRGMDIEIDEEYFD